MCCASDWAGLRQENHVSALGREWIISGQNGDQSSFNIHLARACTFYSFSESINDFRQIAFSFSFAFPMAFFQAQRGNPHCQGLLTLTWHFRESSHVCHYWQRQGISTLFFSRAGLREGALPLPVRETLTLLVGRLLESPFGPETFLSLQSLKY